MRNVFVYVLKGGLIQTLIIRVAERMLSKEEVLDGLCKQLLDILLGKDDIVDVMVELIQQKSYIVVNLFADRAHELIKEARK